MTFIFYISVPPPQVWALWSEPLVLTLFSDSRTLHHPLWKSHKIYGGKNRAHCTIILLPPILDKNYLALKGWTEHNRIQHHFFISLSAGVEYWKIIIFSFMFKYILIKSVTTLSLKFHIEGYFVLNYFT
jgi:hypothetical protein